MYITIFLLVFEAWIGNFKEIFNLSCYDCDFNCFQGHFCFIHLKVFIKLQILFNLFLIKFIEDFICPLNVNLVLLQIKFNFAVLFAIIFIHYCLALVYHCLYHLIYSIKAIMSFRFNYRYLNHFIQSILVMALCINYYLYQDFNLLS